MARKRAARPSDGAPAQRIPKANLAGRIGRVSAHYRKTAILVWLVFVVAAWLIGGAVSQSHLTDSQIGTGQSGQGTTILEGVFPYHTAEEVLVQTRGGVSSSAPIVRSAVSDLVARLEKIPTVIDVVTPYSSVVSGLTSGDGHSVLVTFYLYGNSNQAEDEVPTALAATAAAQRDYPTLWIAEFGTASATTALVAAYDHDFSTAEHTSLPITLIVLLIAFGSLMAAGVPLVLGMTAVVAALGLINPLSHLFPVAQGEIGPVVLLIGLAVGVDYSMFYLRRQLEERRRGLSARDALARASQTSGAAVLVSGLTVLTAMAGMFFVGSAVFSSLALGTMLVVAITIVGSVTVLPALIASLGDHVEWGPVPFIAHRRRSGATPVWGAIVRRVLKRPALSATLALVLLGLVAAPALTMRTVAAETVGLPPGLPIVMTMNRIERAFPGAPVPAYIVVTAPNVTAPAVETALTALGRDVLATPGLAGPVVEMASANDRVALMSVSIKGNGVNGTSTRALTALRDTAIPDTIGKVAGVSSYVTGLTAESVDFNSTMASHLIYVIGFVLGLAFVLLLVTFRSLVIPLLTIVLNVLSVGAAYGAVVLIFQRGWLRGLIGAPNIGGVVNWLPLFLFVVLFGLSMDYHVLILSRIREGHRNGLPTKDAVANGITSTAGVITSAAVVMIAVFSIFGTLSEVIFKQLGVALVIAVLIDATVVRVVLLPSLMTLLGRWNWYLPGTDHHQTPPVAPPTGERGIDRPPESGPEPASPTEAEAVGASASAPTGVRLK